MCVCCFHACQLQRRWPIWTPLEDREEAFNTLNDLNINVLVHQSSDSQWSWPGGALWTCWDMLHKGNLQVGLETTRTIL